MKDSFVQGSAGIWSQVKKSYPIWLVGTGAMLIMMQMGALISWMSPYMVRLMQPNSPIPINADEASWLATLLNVGVIFGVFMGLACLEFWSKKISVLTIFVPLSINWILTIIANSVWYLHAARFIAGLGTGITLVTFSLYVGEVASPKSRGAVGSVAFCGSPVGALIGSYLGSWMSLAEFGICFLIPCFLGFGIFWWMPELPYYLVKNHQYEKAEESLKWYRGGENVDGELKDIVDYVTASQSKTFTSTIKEFQIPYFRKMLILVIVLFTYMQICGQNTLLLYVELVLKKAKFDLIEPALVLVLMYATGIFFSFLAVFTIDSCGRRFLMMVSSFGIALAMVGLGTHFLLMDLGYDPANFQFLPISSVLLFQALFYFGQLIVPVAVMGEVFPSHLKSTASCVTNIISGIFAIAATKSFQPLIDTIGDSNVFFLNAVLMGTAIPFVIYCMPETKGKSLNQIQTELKTVR